MEHKIVHFLYCPFTGLGLYGGYRGKRWLRNRIKIFKQFVIPSLRAQTNQNFVLWISWRHEDRTNPMVKELYKWLMENYEQFSHAKFVFTYGGVCFWDDKYCDQIAHNRLVDSVHASMPYLFDSIQGAEHVLMTIQPSDDCYHKEMVEEVQSSFAGDDSIQAVAYKRGYVMDYKTKTIAEWNPDTNPPFYTIKFDRETFVEPLKHVAYAGIKSHEYLPDVLKVLPLFERRFLVGTHGENISTVFNHPFRGYIMPKEVLKDFGLYFVEPLKLSVSLRKILMRKLPHKWQRKLRYLFGERFSARIYDFIRS